VELTPFRCESSASHLSGNAYKQCIGVCTNLHDLSGDDGFLLRDQAFCFVVGTRQKCHGRGTAEDYDPLSSSDADVWPGNGSVITVRLDLNEFQLSFDLDGIAFGKAFDLPTGVAYHPCVFLARGQQVQILQEHGQGN